MWTPGQSGVGDDKRMREKKKHIACGACTKIVQGICETVVSRYPAGQVILRSKWNQKLKRRVACAGRMTSCRWRGGGGDCQIKDWGKPVQGLLYCRQEDKAEI